MGERPEFKCRRDEDQVADEGGWGVEGGGCEDSGMWVWDWVLCLLPRKKIDFASQIGEFWCKWSAFFTVQVNPLKLV